MNSKIRYTATYIDSHGSEEIFIFNDGETLQTIIRGFEFSGDDFDSLEPSNDITPEQLKTFTLYCNALCSCEIKCEIPIPIYDKGQHKLGNLVMALYLGQPTPRRGLDREELSLVLHYDSKRLAGSGESGWFEDELVQIQKQLPSGVFMQACINCLYSDYSPLGHGLFGTMMCFRNIKQEYLKVTNKGEFWSVHNQYDRFVQETYLCSEFQRREPNTGYRG